MDGKEKHVSDFTAFTKIPRDQLLFSFQFNYFQISEKGHDPYCWHCVKDETDLKCSKCIRSFHAECLTGDSNSVNATDGFVCILCEELHHYTNNDMYIVNS